MPQHWTDWERDSTSELADVVIKMIEMISEKITSSK